MQNSFYTNKLSFIIIGFLSLSAINLSAQSKLINKFEQQKKDSVAREQLEQSIERYQSHANDNTNANDSLANDNFDDDIMENHPAADLYNNIWSRERVNPYETPPSALPDSIYIDCSEFHFPLNNTYVTSHFGPRWRRMHYGTDLKLQTGDSVLATFSGKVRIVDYEPRGYGNYIVLRHNNGLETVYGHLSEVLVYENQEIKEGDLIAFGGSTGRSTGPHLHFEFRYMGNAFDTEHLVNYANGILFDDVLLITKDKMFGYQSQRLALQSRSKYYTVRHGDTLSKIAARNGVSVRTLTQLNNLKSASKIKAGKRLRIR
ncbi:MAG: peptidoglycan DD-metalloendopeptidase family protein [Prevotellaceae bacterium]|jgi:murein DD-endopeptidase MepM/ murein hydrolase activator NlpD|nr:peptidoglycan DD-metalloendopeptidase family protein [Prevotellaceae bacterium]